MKVLWFLPLLLPLPFSHSPTTSRNICLGLPVATAPTGPMGSLENTFLCMRKMTDASSESKASGTGRLHCTFSGQLICTRTVVVSLPPHQWRAHVSSLRNSWAVWAVLVQSSDPQLGHLSTVAITASPFPASSTTASDFSQPPVFCFASSTCYISDREIKFQKTAFLTAFLLHLGIPADLLTSLFQHALGVTLHLPGLCWQLHCLFQSQTKCHDFS